MLFQRFLLHYAGIQFTLIEFIILMWMLNITTSTAHTIAAHVRITNRTCVNSGAASCAGYKLKIGYTRVKGCAILTGSISAFAQNNNEEKFWLSSKNTTTFTTIPKNTLNERLIVVVFDNLNQLKATSCENLRRRHVQGNMTKIHTDAYNVGSAIYSFDIEIITVCSSMLCTGLRCNHCVTTTTQTSQPILSTTSMTLTQPTTKQKIHVKTISTTAIIETTNTSPKEDENITTANIALIAVIIALLLVLLIFLYKWWNGKNKVDDHKISSTINKESTENNGRKQTNKPNNDEKKEREYKENSDLGNNEVVSSKPNSDKQTGKIVGNPKELNADNNKIQSEKANNSRKTNRNKRRKTDNEFETNEDEKTKRQRNKKRNKKDEKANHMDKCATVKEINANHSHNEKHNKRDENGSHIHKCGTENERKENHSYKDNQKQTEPFCNKEYSSEKCEATPDDKNNAIRNSRIHTARDSREAAIRKIEMKNTDSEITRPKSAQDSKYPDKGSLESHENNQNQTAPPKSQVQTLIMVGEAC